MSTDYAQRGGNICYKELAWVYLFMKNTTVETQLGVDPM